MKDNSRKILFLPHCLREDYSKKIQEVAKNKGYDVYVVCGGSEMKNILKKYDFKYVKKFVGVACEDEVGLAKDFAKKVGILEKVVAIGLDKDGCRDTECDLNNVFDVI